MAGAVEKSKVATYIILPQAKTLKRHYCFHFKTTAFVSITLIRYKFQHYLAPRLPTLNPLERLVELVNWEDTVKCGLSNPQLNQLSYHLKLDRKSVV